jgi:hypothetical protein
MQKITENVLMKKAVRKRYWQKSEMLHALSFSSVRKKYAGCKSLLSLHKCFSVATSSLSVQNIFLEHLKAFLCSQYEEVA